MKRFIIWAFVAWFGITIARAQETLVWEKPVTAYSKLAGWFDVAKVELGKDQTVVTFHIDMPAGRQIGFTGETMLLADGKEYKIKAIREFNLNEGFTVPKPGKMDITMLFEAVPLNTRSVTFTMPGAFSINNIHDRNRPKEGIADTYWRDEKTGDWILGVAKNAVVYDNKVWGITSLRESKGGYAIQAKNCDDILSIIINKEKKGKRVFRINGRKALCSLITSDFLPDYPTKDATGTMANNGYRSGDSVTIVGWYKDMPQEAWKQSGEFEAAYTSVFTDNEVIFSAKLDSLGRFTLRMPIENTQMLYCDWRRCNLMFPVEPNETYFLLKDFAENKTLLMGGNARLQNEYWGNRLRYENVGGYRKVKEYGGLMPYLSACDSMKKIALGVLDEHIMAHPTLSGRYERLMRNSILTETAADLMQARFSAPNHELPKEYVDFVTDNYWNKIEEPFTMTGNRYTTFFRDYTGNLRDRLPQSRDNACRYGLLMAEKEGRISLSDADRIFIDEYAESMDVFIKKVNEAPDSLRQQMVDEYNAGDMVTRMNRLLERDGVQDAVNNTLYLKYFRELSVAMDSLGWSPVQRDMLMATNFYERIDQSRQPLPKVLLDYATETIGLESAKRAVTDLNDKYEAIGKQRISADNFRSPDDVKDLSEGGQILRKILEPHKGKIVLLDIWGTWCGPCKEAISHSQEEFARLKPYDMVFLYLVNRSSEESWKNVIKEYKVTGENVVHYNLPDAQQKAIENHLGVRSFPSYKLFDTEGNLLDVNADPRNLDALENLVKRLSGK